MPMPLAVASAYLFTAICNLIKKPPIWGMSVDQINSMKEGVDADGSKAEHEPGITYTTVKVALEEQIEGLRD